VYHFLIMRRDVFVKNLFSKVRLRVRSYVLVELLEFLRIFIPKYIVLEGLEKFLTFLCDIVNDRPGEVTSENNRGW